MNKLTKIQAFNAMIKFLENYYERTSSDDIGSLLGDLQFLKNGETFDSAAWQDWIECINEVLEDNKHI